MATIKDKASGDPDLALQFDRDQTHGPEGSDEVETTAVVVYRQEGQWQVGLLPSVLGADLDGLVAAVKQQSGDGGSFALVDVAHEFFVIVRVTHGRERFLLSDVTAAVAWDLALQVVEELDLDVPGEEDLDDVLPAGDLGIFADLGLEEMEMGMVLSDTELYADEVLLALARRLGFVEPYEKVITGLD
jgi:putative tRNA adenosine deaminase-associated protein